MEVVILLVITNRIKMKPLLLSQLHTCFQDFLKEWKINNIQNGLEGHNFHLYLMPSKQQAYTKTEKNRRKNLPLPFPYPVPVVLVAPVRKEVLHRSLCFLMPLFRHLSCLHITHYDKWIISYSLHLLIIDKTTGIQL